ncbi:uncharacterized protein LOC108042487 [Drosophila rhopaloa]|uniref:Uncharacterized protein LOC108042487 n=1 Tax=Drosophila rhopaloa TaxID=1041015 RepID=A0A6P4EMP3_DRORH|nr:uncharacterized protein LOC108042487 [Drosophila rhopaloa]
MLNGKFYTGLPPKMEERQGVKVCNRQESHFYWPDDSLAESAVENRVRRRNSQQLEKPVERIISVQDSPSEVDTRRMFHKEFASSSIQFYDNLQSNPSKRPPLERGLRRELTPKLTEVRAQELDNKAEDTSNRRQQAYSSKIQFYDYVNEADNTTQNNVRRPQMDFNDKREVELNTKNSPKLQVKRNVRSFSVELEPKVTKKPLNDSPEWRRPRPLPQPKKILKQTQAQDQDAFDCLENRVRRLQLTRSPGLPKKHVTYNEEAAEYAYYDDRDDIGEPMNDTRPRQQPNMPTGSRQQQQRQQQHHSQQQHQHQRQQQRSFMETSRAKPLNNNNNYQPNASGRKILPKLPESPVANIHMVDDDPPVPSDPRKHLRSSLCFSGDALMVGGQAAQSTAQARRSSAGQRISVGLPD